MASLFLRDQSGTVHKIDRKAALCSGFIKNILETTTENEVINLPNISTEALDMVVEWLEHHKDDDPDEIVEWSRYDAEFLETHGNRPAFVELANAANLLDIQRLSDLVVKKLAETITQLTPEQIRQQFNIKNDLTPSEIARIREENALINVP